MKNLVYSVVLMSAFPGCGFCSSYHEDFSFEDNDHLSSIEFSFDLGNISNNNAPKAASPAKRPLENLENESKPREPSPSKKNRNSTEVQKGGQNNEPLLKMVQHEPLRNKKHKKAGKALPEPVAEKSVMSSAQAIHLAGYDDCMDEASGENEQPNLKKATRARAEGYLYDGSNIANAKLNRRPKISFVMDEDKKAGVIFPEAESPWCIGRDLTIAIIRLLDSAATKSAALTCRYFANKANTRFGLKFASGVAEQDIANVLATKCKFLRHLDLSQCVDLRAETFKRFTESLNLVSLVSYPNITADALKVLGKRSARLTSIKILFPEYVKSYKAHFAALSDCFSNLTYIELANFSVFERKMKAVTHLLNFISERDTALALTLNILDGCQASDYQDILVDKIKSPFIQLELRH